VMSTTGGSPRAVTSGAYNIKLVENFE
jgi:hypothetical protein